jgi:hypothetical protein
MTQLTATIVERPKSLIERCLRNQDPFQLKQLMGKNSVYSTLRFEEQKVVKKKKLRRTRKPYTPADIKLLRQHSKARTKVAKIAKSMKRSEGSLRQKARTLGIGLGHLR